MTDLAHSDLLTLTTADNQFAVSGIQAIGKHEQDALRYAMSITAQPRRGLSADIPIRRFSWDLPEGGFQLPDVMKCHNGFASFSVRFGDSFTNPVSAEIGGLMNSLGEALVTDSDQQYGYEYDAFMSGLVFLPEPDCSESRISRSLSGKWSTQSSSGFSSPLTHAFSIALRNRMAGLSFFAMTPVFLIEGRDGSFGRLLLWLLEPCNSGSTVYPLLAKKLFRDQEFKKVLLEDVQNILLQNNEYVTLAGLRSQSQMAFVGEDALSAEQWQSEIECGLYVIKLLLRDAEALKKDAANREEKRKKREEEQRKRRAELIDPSVRSEEDEKQFREFTSQVTSDLLEFKEVIDVSRFCTEYGWSTEKVTENFWDVLWNSPEIFFVAKVCRTNWSFDKDGKITSCCITGLIYGISKEEYAGAKRTLDREIAEAMKLLDGVSDPVKKALILHDHIVRICDYDEEARDKKDSSPRARTAYSVLVRHRAVCEGYTMAYRYLLKRAGIRSEEVLSDEMNHCWNYLYLNGHWYHVDVTWDDPVYRGRKPNNDVISHEFFLLSDEKIRSREHTEWSVRGLPPADDTEFDDKDWSTY